jgi:hypothetical protein
VPGRGWNRPRRDTEDEGFGAQATISVQAITAASPRPVFGASDHKEEQTMTRRTSSEPDPQDSGDPGPLAEVENLLLLHVLRDDHAERWTREELRCELHDINPAAIDESLEGMEAAGVVVLDGEHVERSRCAQWFNALGVICI